jgi:SAM-dependent MidA family methyltransferase
MPTHLHTQLPPPTPEGLAHSQTLLAHVRDEIAAAGGWISFAQYMTLAMYAPGLGYYSSGAAKFGAAGDFVTAPELSPLFGQTLAHFVAESLTQTGGDVLELGAGSGRLALAVLTELDRLQVLPTRYWILEVSPDLRARQHALLAAQIPHLLDRVGWIDTLPEGVRGVVMANEVLDALPVHLVHWTEHGVLERGVVAEGEGLGWADRDISDADLRAAVSALPVSAPFVSEINLAAPALVRTLGERLQSGCMLLIDYGFPRAEYYHPQRHEGTLKVHYRHHSLDDPFFMPGLADITAHVDFSALAQAGEAVGLELLGYTNQGRFLLDAGLLDLMSGMLPGTPDYLRAVTAVQKLVQPHEMGELFKVMVLGRALESSSACRRIDRL